MHTLVATRRFQRQGHRVLLKRPDFASTLESTLDALTHDLFQPRLRLHAVRGKLLGVNGVRVTFGYRITLTLRLTEWIVALLIVGAHDQVYR
ncbi:MAG: plasmid stabilization protein [Chloroflexota bacterium]|nr:plasmid stabilization protein [Chloroflexota bacterium]